ncbi:hypothetical protein HZU75_04295 [Chitinibacter fontanus]|uniref:Uncharacterized protein n=1 Tax=Chitinibacter fontanus TaxID=1737446 RepID=A0A7D5V8M6_9NEIS|nr:hypothetical protein [Chitinibacter fontanus]QLI80811.1 hypothetical protein HZU75_04295 [Chitinibacter fontanus]
MKVVEVNDCDWYVGESVAACVAQYIKEVGEEYADHCEDARALSDDELDALTFTVVDENEVPDGSKRTFREQLAIEIAAGGDFPRLFATTEN